MTTKGRYTIVAFKPTNQDHPVITEPCRIFRVKSQARQYAASLQQQEQNTINGVWIVIDMEAILD